MLCLNCGKSLGNVEKTGRCEPCESAYQIQKQKERDAELANERTATNIENNGNSSSAIFVNILVFTLIALSYPLLLNLHPQKNYYETNFVFACLAFSLISFRYVLELWFKLITENIVLGILALFFPLLLLRSLFVYEHKPIKQIIIIAICSISLFGTNIYYYKKNGKHLAVTLDKLEDNWDHLIDKKFGRS